MPPLIPSLDQSITPPLTYSGGMDASLVPGRFWMLAFFIAVCFVAAGLGSWLSGPGRTAWYATLRKPAETPPNWVFGPVWTVLYVCMAVAAWLVWESSRIAGWHSAQAALSLWSVQLAVNVAWSWLFFGRRRPDLALMNVIALAVLVLLTLIAFQSFSATAGWLLVPYLLWVVYAARLNYLLWQLNR